MTQWSVDISFTHPALDPFDVFDVLERLESEGAVATLDSGGIEGDVRMTLEAPTVIEAATIAIAKLHESWPLAPAPEIVGVEVATVERQERELGRPTIPPLVGYGEIAEMAGVTRQRVSQLAKMKTFPEPLVKTRQGPLYGLHAVKGWLENRNTRPGRQKPVS